MNVYEEEPEYSHKFRYFFYFIIIIFLSWLSGFVNKVWDTRWQHTMRSRKLQGKKNWQGKAHNIPDISQKRRKNLKLNISAS